MHTISSTALVAPMGVTFICLGEVLKLKFSLLPYGEHRRQA